MEKSGKNTVGRVQGGQALASSTVPRKLLLLPDGWGDCTRTGRVSRVTQTGPYLSAHTERRGWGGKEEMKQVVL